MYVRSSYSTVHAAKSSEAFIFIIILFFLAFLSLKFLGGNFQFWQRWLNFLFVIWEKQEEEADI
jgi:hypothetical protein